MTQTELPLLTIGEHALLGAMRARTWTLTELTTRAAAPVERDESGFPSFAYVERWCACHERMWETVCRLKLLGLIEDVSRPVDPPAWRAVQ